ncbi:MAG TPA: response regulator transcription factor [Acidisoma sp.]|nr:response regulator transcription factor [Acidisoma sp.]
MKPAAGARQRILLVDDHPFMRAGLAQLLNQQPDLQLGGEAGHPSDAAKLLASGKWDLVLTDITMPGRSGLDFIKDLHALYPELPILVVSMHDEAIYAERALRAGARGYIMEEAGAEKLLEAVRRVLSGKVYVSAELSAKIVDALSGAKPRGSNSPIAKLTDREFEIFQLIGHGKSTKEIASQLHLSSKTVDVHRSHIKEKLELTDATALVRHAVRWIESGGQESS